MGALEFDATFLDADQDHEHDPNIRAVGVKLRGVLNQSRLNAFFAEVMKKYPKDMYRMKGILDVKGIEEKFVFHAVNCHFGGMPQGPWPDGVRESRAIFIGRGIDDAWLTAMLRGCFEDPYRGIMESNCRLTHS